MSSVGVHKINFKITQIFINLEYKEILLLAGDNLLRQWCTTPHLFNSPEQA